MHRRGSNAWKDKIGKFNFHPRHLFSRVADPDVLIGSGSCFRNLVGSRFGPEIKAKNPTTIKLFLKYLVKIMYLYIKNICFYIEKKTWFSSRVGSETGFSSKVDNIHPDPNPCFSHPKCCRADQFFVDPAPIQVRLEMIRLRFWTRKIKTLTAIADFGSGSATQLFCENKGFFYNFWCKVKVGSFTKERERVRLWI